MVCYRPYNKDKSLEKHNINDRCRTPERLPVHRVCVGNRKGMPGKWNDVLRAMKSSVCSWGGREIGPMQQKWPAVGLWEIKFDEPGRERLEQ